MRTIISFTISVLLWTSLVVAAPTTVDAKLDDQPKVQCEGETRTGVSDHHGHVEYVVKYNRSTQRVCVVAESTGNRKGFFGYSVWIDDTQVSSSPTMELDPGDTYIGNQTITRGIDATRDTHNITINSYGSSIRFNFTKRINPQNEQGVPTPHIEKIIVERNDTKSGGSNIIVDVENEGVRNYNPEVAVKTFQSNLRWVLRAGNSKGTHQTRLNEAEDDIIVGTVKLYGDTYYTGTKWDRISFVSYPNGSLKTWEPAFGEIPTNREVESRQIYYENESLREKYRGPNVDPISERASKVGAAVVATAVVASLWYQRRRRRR